MHKIRIHFCTQCGNFTATTAFYRTQCGIKVCWMVDISKNVIYKEVWDRKFKLWIIQSHCVTTG